MSINKVLKYILIGITALIIIGVLGMFVWSKQEHTLQEWMLWPRSNQRI